MMFPEDFNNSLASLSLDDNDFRDGNSFLNPGLSMGDRLREILQISGQDILPHPEEVNQLFEGRDDFNEWFLSSLINDNILLEKEVEEYELSEEIIPEEEVDRVLFSKFGHQDNKLWLCPETFEKKLVAEASLRKRSELITSINNDLRNNLDKMKTKNFHFLEEMNKLILEESQLKSSCLSLLEDVETNSGNYIEKMILPPFSVELNEKFEGSGTESALELPSQESLFDALNKLHDLFNSFKSLLVQQYEAFRILPSLSTLDTLFIDTIDSNKYLSVCKHLEEVLLKSMPYIDYRGFFLKEFFSTSLKSMCKNETLDSVLKIVDVPDALMKHRRCQDPSLHLSSMFRNLVASEDIVTVEILLSVLISIDSEFEASQMCFVNHLQYLNEQLTIFVNSIRKFGDKLCKISEEVEISQVNETKQSIADCHHLVDLMVSEGKGKLRSNALQLFWLFLRDKEKFSTIMEDLQNRIQILVKATRTN